VSVVFIEKATNTRSPSGDLLLVAWGIHGHPPTGAHGVHVGDCDLTATLNAVRASPPAAPVWFAVSRGFFGMARALGQSDRQCVATVGCGGMGEGKEVDSDRAKRRTGLSAGRVVSCDRRL